MFGGGLDVAWGNYADARAFRADRPRKWKIGNNTWIRDHGAEIAVLFHRTEIVVYRAGSVSINSGGWQTSTTKSRINCLLPAGWDIWQQAGEWYLSSGPWWPVNATSERRNLEYVDGITIHDSGRVTLSAEGPEADVADPEADRLRHNRGLAQARRAERKRWEAAAPARAARANADERHVMDAADAAERRAIRAGDPIDYAVANYQRAHNPEVDLRAAKAADAELSRDDLVAEIERRRESVLAEYSKGLPLYVPR